MAKKNSTPHVAGAKDSKKTRDSFANFSAALGLQTNNLSSGSTYVFDFITKNRILLEAMYRTSWIVGSLVDVPADDMTKCGISIMSVMPPGQIEEFQEALDDLRVWKSLCSTVKWARLYGSCLGVLLVDGQDFSTPLRIDTVGKNSFRGILPIDRWQVVPSISNRIKTLGPDMGMPKFYDMVPDAMLPDLGRIHHSRVIRLDGLELPHYQKQVDNYWGESVVERMHDRLVAFDSATTGAAQLVYRAYLRTWKVEGLREIISSGGAAYTGLLKHIEQVRQFQASEGITLLDQKDEFETHTYSFAGLDDVLLQFGQQLSGALEIPLVRLFGQSPSGLNSSGESDLRTYYDGINKKQNFYLKHPVKRILEILSRSMFGKPLPKGFAFQFNPLYQLTDKEKSDIAKQDTDAVCEAFDNGLVSMPTALRELRQSSHTTGRWSNITDEEIKDAENAPPPADLAAMGADALNNDHGDEPGGAPGEGNPSSKGSGDE